MTREFTPFRIFTTFAGGVAGRCGEKDMDIIRDNFHGIYLKFIVFRNLTKDLLELTGIGFREYLFPILWYPYQTVLGAIDRMRSPLDPCYSLAYFSACHPVKFKGVCPYRTSHPTVTKVVFISPVYGGAFNEGFCKKRHYPYF
jgi:hypothetical protein